MARANSGLSLTTPSPRMVTVRGMQRLRLQKRKHRAVHFRPLRLHHIEHERRGARRFRQTRHASGARAAMNETTFLSDSEWRKAQRQFCEAPLSHRERRARSIRHRAAETANCWYERQTEILHGPPPKGRLRPEES
jgi:hypothetical protein